MMISFAFNLYFSILCFQYAIYKYIHHLTFTTPGDINIIEFKHHLYGKWQTSDSSWEFLSTGKKLRETPNLCVEIMNSKRQVKKKPGHMVQILVWC